MSWIVSKQYVSTDTVQFQYSESWYFVHDYIDFFKIY